MAQSGDEITYTFSGAKETEDISNVDSLIIRRMDGAGGADSSGTGGGGSGGQIRSAEVDISAFSDLDIWVGEGDTRQGGFGRSDGGSTATNGAGGGGGSTEILASSGEFIAAADAGGGGSTTSVGGSGGARGGQGGSGPIENGNDAEGAGFGGDGANLGNNDGGNGGQELGGGQLLDNGSLNTGGGGGQRENAEVVLLFDKPQKPDSLTVTENLDTVGPTVDISWTNPGADRENRVYRAPGSTATFPDDFSEIATVSAGREAFTDSPSYESTFTYVVTATLNGGESEPSAQKTLTTSSEGELVVTITNTNSPVSTGDTLDLDVEVENIGDYRADENIDAVLEPQ